MKDQPLVSVIVPVYNRAHLVPRVVGSICAQSYRNLEILVVDDCSTDDVAGAAASLGDPRVRLVRRQRNGGVAAARNTGVEAASADYIAFHDSDDICMVDRIERSMELLLSLPEDYIGVYGVRLFYAQVAEADYRRIYAEVLPRAYEPIVSGDLYERTVRDNILNFPTLLLRAAALRAAGPSDELLRKNVDWDLSLRLTRLGKFGFISEPLVVTPDSLDPQVSANRVSRSIRQGARSFAHITRKLKLHGHKGPALARHYGTAAKFLMRMERPRAARKYLAASLSLNPVQPKLWAHYILSYAPGLHRKLRRPRPL